MRLIISLLLIATVPQQERPVPSGLSAPGTYDILICKGPCTFASTSNVLVRGSLILEAQSFQPSSPPQDARSPYAGLSDAMDSMLRGGRETNACFVLETLERNRTNAGLIPIGFPAWSQVGNTVTFKLYGSPDSAHNVSVALNQEGFSGTGTSSGVGGGAPPESWTPVVILGRRTGPADRSICTRAVEGASRR